MPPLLEFFIERKGGLDLKDAQSLKGRKSQSVLLSPQKKKIIEKRRSLSGELDQRRKVRFSNVETIQLKDSPVSSSMSEAEKSSVWWGKDELQASKESAIGVIESMDHRPNCAAIHTDSYQTVLRRINDACSRSGSDRATAVTPDDTKQLADWHKKSHVKRGLEQFVLDSAVQRKKTQETLLHAIDLLSKNGNIDDSTKAESIRSCAERLTSPSRMFAKALADADAECVRPKERRRRSSRRSILRRD